MAALRLYRVEITIEAEFIGDGPAVEVHEVIAETFKPLEDVYLFQTYVEESSCFRTDAAFDRVEGRAFSITSSPVTEDII